MLHRIAQLAVLLTFCAGVSPAQSYDDALARMRARAQTLRTYRCTFTSFARGPAKTDNVSYKYYFKKPNWVRMEVQTGKYEGTVLLYTGGDVRIKPGHGVLSYFSYSFAPDHKYVCDPRGNGVHQSSWGYYIDEHAAMKALTRSAFTGYETIGGRKALRFELASADPEKTRSIAVEQLWIDAEHFVPLQYKQFDRNGTLLQSGFYQDIVLDCALSDSLFTETSK